MTAPQITHLGAKDCVTGSCHLLQVNDLAIMIDCGLAQGHDTVLPMAQWPITPAEIDYLFLTHAHIDHIGRLPELLEAGFSGEIICSHGTKELLAPMLDDALSFSAYTPQQRQKMINKIADLSWGFELGISFKLKKSVSFTLGRAGHILGSVFVHLVAKQTGSPDWRVLFSGDLGNYHTPILPDPDPPPCCDLLVMESTYGNHNHGDRDNRLQRLGKTLVKALADDGKVFIPAFALGRTQEILFELDRLFTDPKWQQIFPELQQQGNGHAPVPVFIDSPLALRLTEIYTNMQQCWDKEAAGLLAAGDHPFDFHDLYPVQRFTDHRKIVDYPGSAIIIAGSGMCTGGRIIDHITTGLTKTTNDILFVGYQARGTPGRDIIKYSRYPRGYVRLDGQKVSIKAKVHKMNGYSAHADQHGLLTWLAKMAEKPNSIRLVHGEPDAQQELTVKLRQLGYEVDEGTCRFKKQWGNP